MLGQVDTAEVHAETVLAMFDKSSVPSYLSFISTPAVGATQISPTRWHQKHGDAVSFAGVRK